MVKDDTLYQRIGVSSTATKEEIKRKYRILSMTAHPDKNPNDYSGEANRIYQEINQAKDVLLDDEKRRIYDQVGMDMLSSGCTSADAQTVPSDFGFDLFAGFGSMFSGGSGGGMFPASRPQTEHITETLNVTLEQLFCEHQIDFTYKHKVSCGKCAGHGTKDGSSSVCVQCNGTGTKIQIMQIGNIIQQSQTECSPCRGKGQVLPESNKCLTCHGKTYVWQEKMLNVALRKGYTSDNKLHFPGQGHLLKTWTSDLMISIHELPHKSFKRHGNHLCLTVELKLYQALFGFTKEIQHLDGRKLQIQATGRTDFNTVRKIPKEGLMGDLFIRYKIEYPDAANEYSVQLKTLLKLMETEEVSREGALKSAKHVEIVCLPCSATDTCAMHRLFDRPDRPDRADRADRHVQVARHRPDQPSCAQQ